jgi:hypothetical protein
MDASRRLLFSRTINPRDNDEDRGRVKIIFPFFLEQPGEVELYIGPGPAGLDTRDWAILEEVVID